MGLSAHFIKSSAAVHGLCLEGPAHDRLVRFQEASTKLDSEPEAIR